MELAIGAVFEIICPFIVCKIGKSVFLYHSNLEDTLASPMVANYFFFKEQAKV